MSVSHRHPVPAAPYWDPVPTARRLVAGGGFGHTFRGSWADRNWRNVPGPFYGANTDTMQMGRLDAPDHIAYDDSYGDDCGTDFVYRQPVDARETGNLLAGAFFGHGGYAMDGDEHWTEAGVREWWSERGRVREWALRVGNRWAGSQHPRYWGHYREAGQGLRDYVRYIDDGLGQYLRGYLFWLAEHRVPGAGDALPLLDMTSLRAPRGRDRLPPASTPGGTGTPLAAGYLVVEPEQLSDNALPDVERLISVSDCLADRLPGDGFWFTSREAALEACSRIRVTEHARMLALLLPADRIAQLTADIEWFGEPERELLDSLAAARPLADGSTPIGWEVLGYDCGLLHTWLCEGLYEDAAAELGVQCGPRGLLASQADAERVAQWANALPDRRPTNWMAGAVVEWDTPIESAFVPIVPEPQPVSWWQRVLGG